jgi:hypothetical protein
MVRAPDLIGDRANSKVDAGWHIARSCACVPETHPPCFTRLAGVRDGGRRGSRFVVCALGRDRPFDAARL